MGSTNVYRIFGFAVRTSRRLRAMFCLLIGCCKDGAARDSIRLFRCLMASRAACRSTTGVLCLGIACAESLLMAVIGSDGRQDIRRAQSSA